MIKEWLRKARNVDQLEIILTVDADDQASQDVGRSIDGISLHVQEDLPGTCVKGWNLAASKSSGKIIIAVADDFLPPARWDERLLRVDKAGWIDRPHVVHVNDAFVQDLVTLAIMTRPRYEYLGYLFYPGYQSIYCDTDLTYHSKQDKVLIEAGHLVFEHHHPDNRMRVRDAVDVNHSSEERYKSGKKLFDIRKAAKFPREYPMQQFSFTAE